MGEELQGTFDAMPIKDKVLGVVERAGAMLVEYAMLTDTLKAKIYELENTSGSREDAVMALKQVMADYAIEKNPSVDPVVVSEELEVNPTPAMDSVVTMLDDMPTENSGKVDEAMDSSVGYVEPTQPEVATEGFDSIVEQLDKELADVA